MHPIYMSVCCNQRNLIEAAKLLFFKHLNWKQQCAIYHQRFVKAKEAAATQKAAEEAATQKAAEEAATQKAAEEAATQEAAEEAAATQETSYPLAQDSNAHHGSNLAAYEQMRGTMTPKEEQYLMEMCSTSRSSWSPEGETVAALDG